VNGFYKNKGRYWI